MTELEKHYRGLEAIYKSAPINDYFKPELTIRKGEADLKISVREDFFHAARAVHGVIYFKIIDDAAFFAANSLEKDVFVLTSSMNIHFIRPVNSGVLLGEGRVIQYSKKVIIAEAIIYNEKRKEVGRGIGNFIKSNVTLKSIPGYEQV